LDSGTVVLVVGVLVLVLLGAVVDGDTCLVLGALLPPE
jgi:hypothetical protein